MWQTFQITHMNGKLLFQQLALAIKIVFIVAILVANINSVDNEKKHTN